MEVKQAKKAESLVDEWIHQSRKGILGVNYHSVHKDGELWKVKGEVEVAKGLFSTEREEFELMVSSKTGKIVGR